MNHRMAALLFTLVDARWYNMHQKSDNPCQISCQLPLETYKVILRKRDDSDFQVDFIVRCTCDMRVCCRSWTTTVGIIFASFYTLSSIVDMHWHVVEFLCKNADCSLHWAGKSCNYVQFRALTCLPGESPWLRTTWLRQRMINEWQGCLLVNDTDGISDTIGIQLLDTGGLGKMYMRKKVKQLTNCISKHAKSLNNRDIIWSG